MALDGWQNTQFRISKQQSISCQGLDPQGISKDNKASRNLRVLDLSCSTGLFLEIFLKSEISKCHSLDTKIGHMFFWTAYLQLPRGHTHNKDRMEGSRAAVHKQENLLDHYKAGQRYDKCQDSAVPAGGARGRMSQKQQPKRVRGIGQICQHSTVGLGWTSSSGLGQPHAARLISTCCSNGNLLHQLARLSWFHRPSLDTHVVHLELLNHICIFLKTKKQGLSITIQGWLLFIQANNENYRSVIIPMFNKSSHATYIIKQQTAYSD